MQFIDEAIIEVKAGDGGNGSAAFRREDGVPCGFVRNLIIGSGMRSLSRSRRFARRHRVVFGMFLFGIFLHHSLLYFICR